MTRIGILLAGLLACGCSITNSSIGVPVEDPVGLEVGRSTKADALSQLGPPRLVSRQFDGDLYIWRRAESSERSLTLLPIYVQALYVSTGTSLRDDLSLLFDHEGILRGMGLRRETEE